METTRKPFQGVLNILNFNRHFYFIGLSILMVLFASRIIVNWNIVMFWITVTLFVYGLTAPLIVSAYVYDFSGYYNFKWLEKLMLKNETSNKIININAGFDETSFILKNKFPNANLKVFDFYNPKNHTEKAIKRARKVSLVYPNTKSIKTDNIPLEDNSVDIVFFLSSLHEIRSNDEKIEFLKECKRICKEKGHVIMVEHLRDTPNFLAFSLGFTHFFSKKTWIKAYKEAGFKTYDEIKFTPFMSVFNFTI